MDSGKNIMPTVMSNIIKCTCYNMLYGQNARNKKLIFVIRSMASYRKNIIQLFRFAWLLLPVNFYIP